MKITRMEVIHVEMPLREPYTIAYQSFDKASNIIIRLETSSGIHGYGCSAPEFDVTGETIESVRTILEDIVRERLLHSDPLRISYIMDHLKSLVPNSPSALAAVDMALHDILGKYCNIMPVKETIERAKEHISNEFRALKIKGGLDVNLDIERLIKIRETFGNSIELRFDANQGYTLEQTLEFIKRTRQVKLELIEQPTPKEEPGLLEQITKEAAIPIMADESIVNLRDAFRVARKDLADMINIKLMKVGGIAEALHINSVARAARLETMIGCMDETALSIAAGLHFALARPNVLYADLDGHLDLINDPTDGSVILKKGFLYPTSLPGIGFDGII